MVVGWIKTLAPPVVLLTLLAACQSSPYPRNYTRTTAFSPAGYGNGYGCGYQTCRPANFCPPGHILKRIPYSYGGPGRYCAPYNSCGSGCCGAPQYGSSCGQASGYGYGSPRVRY